LCNSLRRLWGRSYEKVKCSEWHKQFKEGRENVEYDKRSGRLQYLKEPMKMLEKNAKSGAFR